MLKKYVTTIEGIKINNEIIKQLRKQLNCRVTLNTTVNNDCTELSGDQRQNIKNYLIVNNIAKNDMIIIHGF